MAYSSFYHFSNSSRSSHMVYSKRGEQMANPDALVRLQINHDMLPSESLRFLLDDLEEPHYHRYNRTFQDYSYTYHPFLQEYKCRAEKRKINQHFVRRWHLTQFIKTILSWGITLAPFICVLMSMVLVRYTFNIICYTKHQAPTISCNK